MIIDIYNTDKKYNIIYADPPWSYKVWSDPNNVRTANHYYKTMSMEELKKLPISNLCEDNSVLFLWVTSPFLEGGLDLMKSWGFNYKTIAFTWVKKNKKSNSNFMGLGYYTRAQSEICLIGRRKISLKRQSKSVRQVIEAPMTTHSAKPPETRKRIVDLFGDLPRIELFAREVVDGWDCWGDEVNEKI